MEALQMLKWVGIVVALGFLWNIGSCAVTGKWPKRSFDGPCYSTRADYDC